MKATIGKTSEKFAANLKQLKKESATQIKRSFDSISTLKDYLTETREKERPRQYTVLNEKIDSVEKKLSGFEDSLNTRVAKLIREYDKLKSSVEYLSKERDIYKTLYEFSIDVTSERDLRSVLKRVVQTTTEILACDYASLQITGEEGEIIFKYDSSLKSSSNNKYKFSKPIADAVLSTGDPISIDADDGGGNIICVPLKTGEDILGILYSVRNDSGFTKFDLDLLQTMTGKIAISVESERLFSALEDYGESLIEDLREKYDFEEIKGSSPQIRKVLATVADVAETESAVLIEGESGTGKELLARALHYNSARKDHPFVAINCAAIPETLLESELFGYEKGAFTGAVGRKPGKFEIADKGTIFMDEIGELSPLLQVKLLRFLQSHEFEPLGSTTLKRADVRIISATKKDLMKMVETGEFRDDLYYRINVIAINLPPLSRRKGDVETLAYHFLRVYAEKNDKQISSLSETALNYLKSYRYPGNIRELENIIERAVVLCKGDILTPNELPDTVIRNGLKYERIPNTHKELNDYKKELWEKTIVPLERNFAINLLESSGGNISAAARMGGMHRKQFQRILNRANVKEPLQTKKGAKD
ncbi:MAG: sigma 54-interacting transcriptional regulator [Candidatus Zixiibacteriota bacterium]|nr:MAG: sigma 54-interacting transcriptional regulator [candidate division Zixibacteria bacterium]